MASDDRWQTALRGAFAAFHLTGLPDGDRHETADLLLGLEPGAVRSWKMLDTGELLVVARGCRAWESVQEMRRQRGLVDDGTSA